MELTNELRESIAVLYRNYTARLVETDADWGCYQQNPTEGNWKLYQESKTAERAALDALELHTHELSMQGYAVPQFGYDEIRGQVSLQIKGEGE